MIFPRTVYALRHNPTGKIYVGSSCDVPQRISLHINALRRGKHIMKAMQDDYNQYGEDYSLFILDSISNIYEKRKESFWMEMLNTRSPNYGYNTGDKSGRFKLNEFWNEKVPQKLTDILFVNSVNRQCNRLLDREL